MLTDDRYEALREAAYIVLDVCEEYGVTTVGAIIAHRINDLIETEREEHGAATTDD